MWFSNIFYSFCGPFCGWTVELRSARDLRISISSICRKKKLNERILIEIITFSTKHEKWYENAKKCDRQQRVSERRTNEQKSNVNELSMQQRKKKTNVDIIRATLMEFLQLIFLSLSSEYIRRRTLAFSAPHFMFDKRWNVRNCMCDFGAPSVAQSKKTPNTGKIMDQSERQKYSNNNNSNQNNEKKRKI